MAEVPRNFRASYFEKVGIKGVEEKKSLDIILKEKRVDVVKLEQFCLRFQIPATYRCYVWKILLGILPSFQEIAEFVQQQRRQQYDDLKDTLTTMQRINQHTPLSHVHLRMFLVEQGKLPLNENKMFDGHYNKGFIALSEGIGQIETDAVDSYWITVKLFQLQHQHKDMLQSMKEQVECHLKKEDPQLLSHLNNTSSLSAVPLHHWFLSCFADVLPETAFERICDRLVAGSYKLLVFVAVSVLCAIRRPLLNKNNTEDIVKFFHKLPDESGDIVVMKALDLWQKHGCPVLPTGRSESPTLCDKTHPS